MGLVMGMGVGLSLVTQGWWFLDQCVRLSLVMNGCYGIGAVVVGFSIEDVTDMARGCFSLFR